MFHGKLYRIFKEAQLMEALSEHIKGKIFSPNLLLVLYNEK